MTSKIHYLKTEDRFFDAIVSGDKTFEVRTEDDERFFHVGDILVLRETYRYALVGMGEGFSYTGREVVAKVSYVLTGGTQVNEGGRVALEHLQDFLKPGTAILGFHKLSDAFNYSSKGKVV